MQEEWDNSLLADEATLSFHFDINGDEEPERVLEIQLNPDGSLVAEMLSSSRRVRGYARVWRSSTNSLIVSFPPRLLKRNLGRYGWGVRTSDLECYDERGEVVFFCTDYAPYLGGPLLRHRP
jgi:hypothetical protein